jgi:hypothetical protein
MNFLDIFLKLLTYNVILDDIFINVNKKINKSVMEIDFYP